MVCRVVGIVTWQMESPWEHIPPDVAGEVMEQLKWDRGASAVFRKICKGWREAHDQSVTRLSVSGNSLPRNFVLRMRFPRVKEIGVCLQSGAQSAHTFYNDQWLRTLTGITALTSLDLRYCEQVSDDGLRTLAGFMSLTSLDLTQCKQVSDAGLRTLAGLTSLTVLGLAACNRVTDNGLLSLSGLTGLTSLLLSGCPKVTDDGVRALLAGLPNLFLVLI